MPRQIEAEGERCRSPAMRAIASVGGKDMLLRSSRIEPYRRTYAKRQPKVSTQPVTQPVEPVSLELSRAA